MSVVRVDPIAKGVSCAQWLLRIEPAMERPLVEIKNDHLKRTVKTVLEPFGRVCLQELTFSPRRRFLSLFRPVPSERIWHYAGDLRRKHIGITEPVLLMVQKKGPVVLKTLSATGWVEGKNLNRLVLECRGRRMPLPEKSITAAADLVTRLHRGGYIHGDLKWSNFICTGENDAEIRLSDLDHIRKSGSGALRAKDFARFVLSAYEYGLPEDFSRSLIAHYLEKKHAQRYGTEILLRWAIRRKKRRYENRYSENHRDT
jgi:tRNA A-37 threonylcarbamoyl transferase component Bud32